jgi:glycosyltransferase involved in cell wall biosynthesis
MIGNLGLSNSVRITLNATDEEKNQALKNSNLYLQPSHEEGFCLAYLEAASVVPLLVGTDTGAIKLISQGDMAARVVAPGQPARIADAVRQLLALSPPRDLLVQREKRLAGYFNWQKYIDAHESLYIRLKADSNPRNEQSNQQQGRAGPPLIHVEEARTQR